MNGKRNFFFMLVVVMLLAAVSRRDVKAADEKWRARYYNNTEARGDIQMSRDEKEIDHDWGDGSPGGGVRSDNFSARWTRTVYLNNSVYRFSATMDDGMRVWIDGALVIDEWQDSQVRTVFVDLPMTAGDHDIEVRYYEAGGKAVAKFTYQQTGGAPSGPPSSGVGRWQGLYYNNQYLGGQAAFTRADSEIDFNWRLGSPWPTIPNDHFSVSWSGQFDHSPGRYRFSVLTDDGVRLWVNNVLLIDEWQDNQSRTFEGTIDLPGGSVPLRLDYYENTGAARITLDAQKISGATGPSPTPTPAPPPPGSSTLPPAGSAVVTARYLNLRSSPENAGQANMIGFVQAGQVVKLLGRNGGWVKVQLPNGWQGWVGGSYLASRTAINSLPVLN